MENIKSIESNFQSKNHDKIDSSKNRRRKKIILEKMMMTSKKLPLCLKIYAEKRNIKLNSIDNSQVLHNNFFDKHPATFIGKKGKE